MRKRNIFIAAALVALTLVTIPLVASAQRRHHGGMGLAAMSMGHGEHLRFLKNELDLSDSQETQLKAIFGEVHEQNAGYLEQMHGDFKEVAQILIANPGDVTRAEGVLAANDQAREQMRQNILRGVARGLSVLTVDQRTHLGQMLAKHTREH